MIPFVDLKREWSYFEGKFLEEFKRFGRAGIYILGPGTDIFEQNFADYCGYKYAVGVSSGLAALEMSLLAHNVKPGDEVITVSNSAVASSLAISNIGAFPVFCDVKDDFLIDENKIENLINQKTKAILPVHLFGQICNMKIINRIARKYNLEIIEDACQAHGAKFSNESSLNTKAFSFYPTKNLGAMGEGGIIVTNDEAIRNFAISYRNYGQNGRYNHEIKGNNYRIDSLQCVFLNIKLKELGKFIKKRRLIAKKYCTRLRNLEDLEVNVYENSGSYHIFAVKVKNGRRDKLRDYLKNKNIDTLVHYPTLIHKQPCYRNDYLDISLPNSEKLQDEILSLPCYPFLTDKEQEQIIEKIINFFNN